MAKKIQKHWFLSIFFLIIGIGFFLNPRFAYAVSCDVNSCDNVGDKQQCLKETIEYCGDLVSQKQQEKRSLNTTISIINGNIAIQQLQINQTLYQINILREEVQELAERIGGLNISLDRLSSILVERVGEQYKRTQVDPIFLLFKGNSLNNFLSEYKYIKLAKQQTLEAMHRAESQRLIYDEQKNLKEQKQLEKEAEEKKLEAQRATLANQKQEKENLLAITKHDESRYQSLIDEAQAQLASFKQFVDIQGGASVLSGQTHCDDWGCYYNQRDSQWANIGIGGTNSSMKEYGCLVSSMAMIASHYSKNITPGDIASNGIPFAPGTAFMWLGTWSINGVTTNRVSKGSSTSLIDVQLDQDKPVIVGLNLYGGYSPDHFIVIKNKIDGEYIMNDPFLENGHDVKLTSKYPLGAIARVDYVTIN